MSDFVHLHVHSDYSLLDGAAPVEGLVKAAADRDMGSLALTDHGNLFGALAFYGAARKGGVKPILGCEMYMAPGSRRDRQKDPATGVSAYHLTVMAKDHAGFRNLVKLASTAYMDGFYYHPRIDREAFAAHHEGLVVLSGCLKGELSHSLRTGNRRRAEEAASFYRGLLGEDFFVEVMRTGAEGQEENNDQLVSLARQMGIPLVATNDVHYLAADDFLAHEARICISTGRTLDDEDRLRTTANNYWLKGPPDMAALFRDLPEALRNTAAIADRCRLALDFKDQHLPRFTPPGGEDAVPYFRRLCREGLEARYPARPAEAAARLDLEMRVIEKMGYVSYFLIVWDFIRFARENGIPVGPGRGSAAGSIVSYCLGITDIDPLKYGLLFERFLNAERVSMPDIDIDFCRDGREKVIDYVNRKYGGPENVSQIITFGTMAARAVLRDVGRVLAVPLPEVDALAKKVPGGPGVTLGAALEQDAELAALREDPRYRRLFDIALRLEGFHRHASVHAAGVVIGDGPLREHVPLYSDGKSVTTQWTMEELEKVGLLKMDFLGLKTLTVLDRALRLIEKHRGVRLDLRDLPPDDPATYAMLGRGDSFGVFQLESGGMRDILHRLRPDRFEDLVAINALYRPGPLQTGMVEGFINRKNGTEAVEYPHPSLREVLEETYGTFVYQEQIMRIANVLAGFSLNEADGLRKAMGKKRKEEMEKYHGRFVAGAEANGCPAAVANRIWDQITPFAEYCFNKSHSAAYAVVTYRTAYLKAHYPVEFMAAFLTCDMGSTDKLVEGVAEVARMRIPLLPPDVNRSEVGFTPDGEAIRFGLAGIRGVGERAVECLMEGLRRVGGRFTSLYQLCESVDLHLVNRQVLEALIKSGAMDGLIGEVPGASKDPRRGGASRSRLMEALDQAMRAGNDLQADRRAGQMSLFGAGAPAAAGGAASSPAPERALPEAPDWPENQVLAFEKETLGFFVSSHPLAAHEGAIRALSTHTTADLRKPGASGRVRVGGMIAGVQARFPKSGRNTDKKYARFRVEDYEGTLDCVAFSEAYEAHREEIVADRIVFLEGTLATDREEPNLRVDRVIPVESGWDSLVSSVTVDAARGGADEGAFRALRTACEAHPGGTAVFVEVEPRPGIRATYRVDSAKVKPGPAFHAAVEGIFGAGCLRFGRAAVAAPPRRGGGGGGGWGG
ncbi:MAG: DNA polymerase III subunit alpha [Planctomycetes bacterium]|nr:DNA polymerase III subunit alpha [Planctomycetota bacterium]